MSTDILQRDWAWERDQKIRALGYSDYTEYVASAVWGSTRMRYRKSGRSLDCFLCGFDGGTLLHHKTYERVGEELLDDLVPLCAPCHKMVHDLHREGSLPSLDPEPLLGQVAHARPNRSEDEEISRDARANERVHRSIRATTRRVQMLLLHGWRNDVPILDELADLEAALDALNVKVEGEPHRPVDWSEFYR